MVFGQCFQTCVNEFSDSLMQKTLKNIDHLMVMFLKLEYFMVKDPFILYEKNHDIIVGLCA